MGGYTQPFWLSVNLLRSHAAVTSKLCPLSVPALRVAVRPLQAFLLLRSVGAGGPGLLVRAPVFV